MSTEEGRAVLGGAADALTSDSLGAGIKYPIRGYRFLVILDGLGLMSFKSVEGFSIDIGSTDYREGAFPSLAPRKIPTALTYPEVTLTKGMYNSTAIYDFIMGYVRGTNTSVGQMTIEVYDNADTVAARWKAVNVWPIKYESGGLSADSADIIVETLAFATEGVFRIAV